MNLNPTINNSLNFRMTSENDITNKNKKIILKKYRFIMIKFLLSLIFICMIIVCERIFYDYFLQIELSFIKILQDALNVKDKARKFFVFMSLIGKFNIIFLVYTHVFVIIYFGFDPFYCIKILYTMLFGMFLMTILNLWYTVPRPFWIDKDIITYACEAGYSHPSMLFFSATYLISYLYYLHTKRLEELSLENLNSQTNLEEWDYNDEYRTHTVLKILEVIGAIIFLVLILFRYCVGSVFIISIILGLVYFGLYFYFIIFCEDYLEEFCKKLSIFQIESKRYSYYCFLIIFILIMFSLIVYSLSSDLMPSTYIENYMSCLEKNNGSFEIPVEKTIGVWKTFLESSLIFALLGSIFGVAHCYNAIPNTYWHHGTIRTRVIRTIIANLLLIPSWVLMILQPYFVDTAAFNDILMNEYYLNAIHFFLLYLFIFGYLPSVVFYRFGLVKTDANYALMQDIEVEMK